MRVLIVSDTHGKHKGIEQAIAMERPLDLLIHLGDGLGYEGYFAELAGCPVEIVAGNSDFFSPLPREKVLNLCGRNIFLTHGHMYYVDYDIDRLVQAAHAQGCTMAMYGHTHRPLIEIGRKMTVLNPGSLTHPRQPGKKPSYIVMDLREGKKPVYTLKYL